MRPLVTAEAVSKLLGFSVDWVYLHAAELGAIRVGSGPRPRLRFDPVVAVERLAAMGPIPAAPIDIAVPTRSRRTRAKSTTAGKILKSKGRS